MAAAKGRRLAVNVVVDGKAFSAGDVPPKDLADQITNPKAWGDDGTSSAAADGSGDGSGGSDGPPPKGGAGSGVEAWAKFAEGKVEVPAGANRDDIIAALEAAGVATE